MCQSNEKFRNRFLQASDKGIGYDCRFIVGSENVTIEGHKFMFSVASEVFQAMFYGELRENHTVKIEDLDADGFKGMKHFIYIGEVNFFSVLHALKTYIAARKYLISELVEECRKYILSNIRPTEVLEFYECCEMNQIPDFEDPCLEMIEKNTDQVVKSEYFPKVKIETIQLILKSRCLKLKSEIEVFNLFEKWALAEAARQQIGDGELATSFQNLKKCIRFLTITAEEFSSRIEHSLLLTDAEKRAIKSNLQEPNSKPMPENLSVVQYQRNFSSTLSKFETNFHISHIFEIRLDKIHEEIERSVKIEDKYMEFYLIVEKEQFKDIDHLCALIRFIYIDFQGNLILQTKISVLAVDENEDLIFTDDIKIFHSERRKNTSNILAAKVPLNELGSNFLLDPRRTQKKTISVRVQMNVILLDV